MIIMPKVIHNNNITENINNNKIIILSKLMFDFVHCVFCLFLLKKIKLKVETTREQKQRTKKCHEKLNSKS